MPCFERSIVGLTQFPGSSKFLRDAIGVRWWLSATAAAFQCLDFRTHNPHREDHRRHDTSFQHFQPDVAIVFPPRV